MKIEVKVDAACGETTLVIHTNKVTDEIQNLVRRLAQDAPQVLVGFRDEEAVILAQEDILRVFAEGGKVFAETADGRFSLRLRLYELEERLDGKRFVRISNSEIVNLHWIRGFDLSFAGTICVRMKNGFVTYVSRRYVAKIKQVLGL
ncbi:MAG: LytTR family DNA-binding domain-containing protein [Eubacteriales bacterium]|nr:LytTR family DNA-binding domain-containing protein [Eubacteriales bacterium]